MAKIPQYQEDGTNAPTDQAANTLPTLSQRPLRDPQLGP